MNQWEKLLEGIENVSFFWTPNWYSVFERDFAVYEFSDEYGRWILPFQIRRKLGLLKIIESAPWGGYGGPVVVEGNPSPKNLAKSMVRLIAMHKPLRAVFVCHPLWNPSISQPNWIFRTVKQTAHILFLTDEPLKLCSDTCRRNYRKALKSGLEVVRYASPSGMSEVYFQLYMDTVLRQRGRPIFDGNFFERLLSTKGVNLFAVRLKDKIIAASIVLVGRNEVFYFHGASLTEFLSHRPNNLLHVEITRWAREKGFTIYNMGSSLGIKSLERFKSSFGAKAVEYPIFRFGI